MSDIERLLSEVSTIRKRYEELARVTGENFNVFKILHLQASEVRLHSAFIAELLNPKGSHGQGDVFLSLFVKVLESSITSKVQLEITTAKVFKEYPIGEISDGGKKGGRIDILIEDTYKKRIIIENKIYALDQPNQLIRYENFDSGALLLYLNLNGKVSDDFEKKSAEGLICGTDYFIISYKNEIVSWLVLCQKEAATMPLLREGIAHYINLIKQLTGQSLNKAMSKDIIELFLKQPEYVNSVPSIVEACDKLKKAIHDQFFEILEEKLILGGFSILIENDLKIHLMADESDKGFYFSYRIVKKDEVKRCQIWETKIVEETLVSKKTMPELFGKYSEKIGNIIGNIEGSSDWSLVWYYPDKFKGKKKLDKIDVNEYVSLYDKEKCEKFVGDLLEDEKKFFEEIKKAIENI